MYKLQDFTTVTGENITREAIHECSLAMHKEIHAQLLMLADGQATICQLQMRQTLSAMKDLITLYKSILNGHYRLDDKAFIGGSNQTQMLNEDFTYINHPPYLSQTEIKNGLRTLTMIRNAFKYSCAYDDYYVGMGIALPNGLFFKYDWFPVPLNYDVRKMPWFKNAIAKKGEVAWFDPTPSSANNKSLLTLSQAVVVNDKIEAVIMINILPQTISNEFVITRGTDCFAFLVAPSGEVVAREDIITKKLIWKLSPEEKLEFKNKIMPKITIGKKINFSTIFKGNHLDVAFSPILPGRWGVGIATPIKSIHSAAGKAIAKIKEKQKVYILSTHQYIEEKTLIYLGIIFTGSIVILLIAAWIALHIGKPIKQLESGIKEFGKRNLDERIKITSNDEFQELGETFNAMAIELNKQINNLRNNIAHQERTKNEFLVAAEIQGAMLPDVSMPFPEHDEFDIYAEMHPAKEVGGDFYDFFFVDKKHLFFTIGDISGKGLSAALFMMRSLTLLRHEAEDGFAPDEILVNVGNELEHNNELCMFFTGTCGLLDITTGEVALSNGGHPPPYLRRDNSFDAIKTENGIIVGALPLKKEQFSITKLKLKKGDTLFFYTDGVTEAFNSKGEEYQSKRLHAALQKLKGANPREILEGVSKSITAFTANAPQSDDITMMTIKYYG
ncbi:MAG: SpoIIE family protein phosphatase [Victivallales bacterium]|nr:SpoIIE family protein phosphatase [Victivallales bacterium]